MKIDGNPIIQWKGAPEAFHAGGWPLPDPKQIGIGGMAAPRVLHELKVQRLSDVRDEE